MKHAKPKLAVFISSLQAGGAERVVSLLIPEFLKTYDVTLILLQKKIAYSIPNDLSMVVLRDYSRYLGRFLALPLLAWQYRKVCQKLSIDYSLSFLNRPNYIAVLAKLMGLHVRVVISERAMPLLQHRSGISGWVNRRLITHFYSKADAVVANSKQNAFVLQKTFGIDVCLSVFNPVILSTSVTAPKNAIFTFVSVGRLDKGKNHQVLIEAMRRLDAHLWIIGEGPLKQVLQRQIDELKLNDKVALLGYQSDPKTWLARADSFVFSSLHEGFPNALLEALSCGLAVISTDCFCGPREILAPQTDCAYQMKNGIEEAEFGILVPINDAEAMQKAMQKMMDDEMLYEYYRTQALKRAHAFAITPIVQQWHIILEDKKLCAE